MSDTKRHPRKLNATQRQALEALYDHHGYMTVTGANGKTVMAASTARVLRDRGLVRLSVSRLSEIATITDAGRRRVQEWRSLAR